VKITITESQLKRLKKVINESNTIIDEINNRIDYSEFNYEVEGSEHTRVTFNKIMLEGDINTGLSVLVSIDKILYTYDGEEDVTKFASVWAIKNHYTGDDLPLGINISLHVADVMNKKYTKYLGIKVTEWDVIIEQFPF
jgi:hypothetical protein